MLEKIKRKAKAKGRYYANKLLGPPSFEGLTVQSSSVSINNTVAANNPAPIPALLEPILDPNALAPPGGSLQVVSISALQPTIVDLALPSTHIPPPASHTNDSNSSAMQYRAPIRATSLGSVKASSAERSAKSTTWSGLKTLLDLLNVCSDAFGPLKSAVGGISKLIEIYDAKAEAGKRYKELHRELDELFRDLSGYLEESMPPVMNSSLDRLTRGIERKVGFVLGKEDRSWIKSAAEAMEDADEILECYRQIQRLFERFLIDASVSTWKIVYEQATERRLEKLSPSLAARCGSAESKHLRRNACTSGTRVDVLEKLTAWAENGESEKIYWLNGMAGTGKTTIAYSFCDLLENIQALPASFFCSAQLETCRNADLIMPTVAYQLARFSHPFRFYLSKVLEHNPDIPSLSVSKQFQKLVFEPLLKAEELIPPGLVVVIDALDECGNKGGVGEILETLISYAPKLPIKFFVASRPEPWIFDPMQVQRGRGVSAELRLHELDEIMVQEDIRKYLKANLGPAKLKDGDLERLVEQSGVLFVYAATVVRYISDDNFSRSAKRLELVLAADPASARGSDHKIGVLYTSILQAAFNDELDLSDRDEMASVLHTIICAREPLTIGVISGLLKLDSRSVQAALRPLRSVLHLSEATGVITTLHKSFPDYMFDKARSQRFHCDAGNHNALLAQRCFNFIATRNSLFNICCLESSYLFDKDVPNIKGKIESAIPKEMVYACQHWGAHLEFADGLLDLLNALHEFLSVGLLLWIEVMNLKDRMSDGVRVLHQIQTWSRTVSISDEIRELALDAWMFALAFSESPISRSTPHLYISALPFWPIHRPVSRHYYPKIQSMVRVVGTAIGRQNSALLALCATPVQVLCTAYSFDGTRIVSGSKDGNIQMWDVHTGQMVGEPLQGHTGAVNSVSYSQDSTRIVSGSSDKTIRIWDAHTGQMVGEPLQGHTSTVYSVSYSHDGTRIISGSLDNTIRIWDAHTGQMVGAPLRGHTSAVSSVSYSRDGTRIVSGSSDTTIRIWDAHTGQMAGKPLQGHTSTVYSVSYLHDGTRIVSGSHDKTIRIWDANTGQMVGEPLQGHTSSVYSVSYSHDGTHIVSGSDDKSIRIWDTHTGQMVGEPLQGHTGLVHSVQSSSHCIHIVTSSSEHVRRVRNARTGQPLDARSSDMQADSEAALAPNNTHPTPDPAAFKRATNLHSDWTLNEDGWVLDNQSQMIIWVPADIRNSLADWIGRVVVSRCDSLLLDFSNAQLGENWRHCYRSEPTLSV